MERSQIAREHLDNLVQLFPEKHRVYCPWPELWRGLSEQQRRVCIEFSKLSTAPRNVPARWSGFKAAEQDRIKITVFKFAGLAAKLHAAENRLIQGAKQYECR